MDRNVLVAELETARTLARRIRDSSEVVDIVRGEVSFRELAERLHWILERVTRAVLEEGER